MEKIVSLRKKRKFQKKLVQLQLRGIADITSYLITPVQRVPRYLLLMTDLLKKTPINHPQYNGLQRALERIKAVAITLNEAGKRIEEINTLYKLGSKIIGTSLPVFQTGRLYIDQEQFKERADKSDKIRQLYLFSDILLLTKIGHGGIYYCFDEINMDFINRVTTMTSVEGPERKGDSSTSSGKFRWGLQISCKSRGSHFLFFKSSQIRSKWADLIEQFRVVTTVRRKMTIQPDGRLMLDNEDEPDEEKKLVHSSTMPNLRDQSKCGFIGKGKEARLIGISPSYAETASDLFDNLPAAGEIVDSRSTATTLNASSIAFHTPRSSGSSSDDEKLNSSEPSIKKHSSKRLTSERGTSRPTTSFIRAKSAGYVSPGKSEGGLSNLIREEFFSV